MTGRDRARGAVIVGCVVNVIGVALALGLAMGLMVAGAFCVLYGLLFVDVDDDEKGRR